MKFLAKPGVVLFAAIAVLAVALILASQGRKVDWDELWADGNYCGYILSLVTPAFFLLAASLIAWRRSAFAALALMAVGGLVSVGLIVLLLMPGVGRPSPAPAWVRVMGSTYLGCGAMSIVLLSVQRLRGSFDAVRMVAIAVVGLAGLLHAVALYGRIFPASIVLLAARAVFGNLGFLYLVFASWCVAFRGSPGPNNPPIDAERTISLNCPRCKAAQVMPIAGGACGNCRLSITVLLDEGVCRQCRYPLRGLTGDRCPECGTPIVETSKSVNAS